MSRGAARLRLGNAQQWTFTVQRALPTSILLEVDYVGSKSTHFDRPAEYNLINVLAGQTQRPLPQWGDIEFIDTDASGTYEGADRKAREADVAGTDIPFTYTFSKTLFDSFAGNGANRLSNPFDARAEKGLAETDHAASRDQLRCSMSCPSFADSTAWPAHILGGWQANGVLTWRDRLADVPDSADRADRRRLPALQSASGPAGERQSPFGPADPAALVRYVGLQDRRRATMALQAAIS